MCFHKIIYKERTGVTFRLMFLDMPVKVVGMERAKQATACLGCQSPYILTPFFQNMRISEKAPYIDGIAPAPK